MMEDGTDDSLFESCNEIERFLRTEICEQLPIKKHLRDVDDEQHALFKKEYLKMHGLSAIFCDSYEKSTEYLESVWSRINPQIIGTLAEAISEAHETPLTKENVKTVIHDYIIEYFLQRFYYPKKERLLNYCNCTKAPLEEKLLLACIFVHEIRTVLPAEKCSERTPVVGTFFGSGKLLNEYVLLSLLGKRGYNFLALGFIDKIYSESPSSLKLYQEFSNQLQRVGCIPHIYTFNSTQQFEKHARNLSLNNHFLIAIDPGDKKRIEDHKAPRRATMALVSLFNLSFNRTHDFLLKFENPALIKAKQTESKPSLRQPAQELSEKMVNQVSRFEQSIVDHFMVPYQSRSLFAEKLQSFIARKKSKFSKKNELENFNRLELSWFKNPPTDFQDFAQKHRTESTLCMMVHNTAREIS